MMHDDEADPLVTPTSRTTKLLPSKAEQWGQWAITLLVDLFWIALVAMVIYFSNFFRHIFFNGDCNRPLLQLSFVLYGTSCLIIGYFIVYGYYICGFKGSISDYNPSLVYAATLTGFFANILLVLGIWPVFGLKSLLMDLLLLKGFFTVAGRMPSGTKGEVLFVGVNVVAALSGLYWQHEGYLHN